MNYKNYKFLFLSSTPTTYKSLENQMRNPLIKKSKIKKGLRFGWDISTFQKLDTYSKCIYIKPSRTVHARGQNKYIQDSPIKLILDQFGSSSIHKVREEWWPTVPLTWLAVLLIIILLILINQKTIISWLMWGRRRNWQNLKPVSQTLSFIILFSKNILSSTSILMCFCG